MCVFGADQQPRLSCRRLDQKSGKRNCGALRSVLDNDCARVKKLLPPLGGDGLSHAEGVTDGRIICCWKEPVEDSKRSSGLSRRLRAARVAGRRGLSLRKPERSEARGGDASQQPGRSTPWKPDAVGLTRHQPALPMRKRSGLARCMCRLVGTSRRQRVGRDRRGTTRAKRVGGGSHTARGTGVTAALVSRRSFSEDGSLRSRHDSAGSSERVQPPSVLPNTVARGIPSA